MSNLIGDYKREEALRAMKERLETGDYAQADLGGGVHLIWDAYDARPYVLVTPNHLAWDGVPDGPTFLADYGVLGQDFADEIAMLLSDVTDRNARFMEFENDGTRLNGGKAIVFHTFWL